jgi:RTX calcium-binding nonapeptide repeat (4 copies)
MSRIYFELQPINATWGLYNHIKIWYQVGSGNAGLGFEGGPAISTPPSGKLVNKNATATVTMNSDPTWQTRIVVDAPDLSNAWSTITSVGANISGEFNYNSYSVVNAIYGSTLTPALNSNSFVASALYWAGLSLPDSIGSVLPGGAPGIETLLGRTVDDEIVLQGKFINVFSGRGADVIEGNQSSNSIFGGYHDDIIFSSGGSDVIHGGQPGIARVDDGFDVYDLGKQTRFAVIKNGAGYGLDTMSEATPDFVVYKVWGQEIGRDRLYSIERMTYSRFPDQFIYDPDHVMRRLVEGRRATLHDGGSQLPDPEAQSAGDKLDFSGATGGFYVTTASGEDDDSRAVRCPSQQRLRSRLPSDRVLR